MIVTIDPNLIDELDGKELKMLLHLVREIVLHGNDAPGNEELMKALGFSKGTMTKVRKNLEEKGFMLRRDPR
ncbi:MAG: MarR family transcriptional regulator, partial [Bacteroidota bacterium]